MKKLLLSIVIALLLCNVVALVHACANAVCGVLPLLVVKAVGMTAFVLLVAVIYEQIKK